MSKFYILGMLMGAIPWGLITMPIGIGAQLFGLGVQCVGLFILIQLFKGKIA